MIIGYQNLIDASTLSGGSWGGTLGNVQNRYLSQPAISVNDSTSSTVIKIDTGSASTWVGLVALVRHNLSSAATVRIRADDSGTMSSPYLYDSGVLSAYIGQDYAHAWWDVQARYWQIDIADTSNPAGQISIGRVMIGPTVHPAAGPDFGVSLAIESKTQVVESIGGLEFFERRPNHRVWRGQLSWLTPAESYSMAWLMKNQDVDSEVVLIEDETATSYRDMRHFYGRMRTLSPIEWPYPQAYSVAVEISELL